MSRIRCSKKTPKNFTELWARRIQRPEKPPHYGGSRALLYVTVGRKSMAYQKSRMDKKRRDKEHQ
jgi:hypothetical protein